MEKSAAAARRKGARPQGREVLSAMRITVLIENTAPDGLTAEHGLSLYLEYRGLHCLLDAGATGAFAANADALDIRLEQVELGILSHGHYDHAGGLGEFLRRNAAAPVYAMRGADRPCYSGDGEKRHEIGIPPEVLDCLPRRVRWVDGVTSPVPGLWLVPHTTPGLDRIGAAKKLYRATEAGVEPDDFSHEMSAVFETARGLVVINSCCHGGLQAVLEEVSRQFPGRPVAAFVGGLHMRGRRHGCEICTFTPEELQAVADCAAEYGVEAVYTGHCTGGVAYELLRPRMGDRLHPLTTGQVIQLPD